MKNRIKHILKSEKANKWHIIRKNIKNYVFWSNPYLKIFNRLKVTAKRRFRVGGALTLHPRPPKFFQSKRVAPIDAPHLAISTGTIIFRIGLGGGGEADFGAKLFPQPDSTRVDLKKKNQGVGSENRACFSRKCYTTQLICFDIFKMYATAKNVKFFRIFHGKGTWCSSNLLL